MTMGHGSLLLTPGLHPRASPSVSLPGPAIHRTSPEAEAVQGGRHPRSTLWGRAPGQGSAHSLFQWSLTNWRGLSGKESFLNIQFCSNYSLASFRLDLTKPSFSKVTKKKCLGKARDINTCHKIGLKPQELGSNCHAASINSHEMLGKSLRSVCPCFRATSPFYGHRVDVRFLRIYKAKRILDLL